MAEAKAASPWDLNRNAIRISEKARFDVPFRCARRRQIGSFEHTFRRRKVVRSKLSLAIDERLLLVLDRHRDLDASDDIAGRKTGHRG